jgi:hypothetical protein
MGVGYEVADMKVPGRLSMFKLCLPHDSAYYNPIIFGFNLNFCHRRRFVENKLVRTGNLRGGGGGTRLVTPLVLSSCGGFTASSRSSVKTKSCGL